MPSYHLSVKAVRRSEGRSATAAAAYRHAERIICDREGRVHDYTRKQGVEHSFIVAPDDAPAWVQDRASLWNAAEARETRVNSVTAREWELALPHELDGAGRRALAEGFARELVMRYRVAADVAIHAPHREGDERNWHAHVLTTTRALTQDGLTDKTRALDAKQTSGAEVEHMRGRWAELQNHALEQQGHEQRVDHRTLALQRDEARALGHEARADNLDRAPEVKLGPVVSAIERREQRVAEREERTYEPLTERGAQVHEARQARSLFAELARELAQVRERLGQELRERAELARQTYAHSREEGADPIRAGLAAIRAAAQRSGVAQEKWHGHDQEDTHQQPQHGHTTGLDSVKEQLARIRGQGTERQTGQEANRDEAQAAKALERQQSLEDIREQLGRIRERENTRTHEDIRDQINAALGRARPVQNEEPKHERQVQERSRKAHQREDDGHDWGL